MKRWEALTQAATWMDPEYRVVSERSRHRRTHSGWFHLYKESERGKSADTEGKLVVSYGPGGRGGAMTTTGYSVSFLSDKSSL